MTRRPDHGSPGAGSRSSSALRSGIGFASLAVLVVAVAAATAWISLEELLDRTLNQELDRASQRVDSGITDKGESIRAALAGAESSLRAGPSELAAGLLDGGHEAVPVARLLAAGSALDQFEILDDEGTVLSAWPWEARAGFFDAEGIRLPAGQGAVVARDSLEGGGIAIAERREVTLRGRSLFLIGASFLDERFVRRVADGGVAELVVGARHEPVRTDAEGAPAWSDIRALVSNAACETGNCRLSAGDGVTWAFRTRELLAFDGRPVGELVVGMTSRTVERMAARFRIGMLLLAGAAAILGGAAGFWSARRLDRALRGLVRTVDAVAAGEADYDFHLAGLEADPAGELAASFTRLHRSLEFQKQSSAASERVAAWRDAARQVAHEVKNPLVPIRLTAQNLQRARQSAPEKFDVMFEDGMRTILEEVDQLSRLVGEFSEYARLPAPKLRTTDVESLIDSVAELYRAEPGVEVERRSDNRLPPFEVDADQISRVLKNVVGNAVEAMRVGGAGDRPVRVEVVTAVEGEMARIEIDDRGPGLPGEAERRLFEPGFTTKPAGSGLGLAISQRIVVEHGGVISGGNRRDGGTSVVIRLPMRFGEVE